MVAYSETFLLQAKTNLHGSSPELVESVIPSLLPEAIRGWGRVTRKGLLKDSGRMQVAELA